jgi:hypothetical protein
MVTFDICNNMRHLKEGGQLESLCNLPQTPNLPALLDTNRTKGNPFRNPPRNLQNRSEPSSDPDRPKIGTGDLLCHRSGSTQEYCQK